MKAINRCRSLAIKFLLQQSHLEEEEREEAVHDDVDLLELIEDGSISYCTYDGHHCHHWHQLILIPPYGIDFIANKRKTAIYEFLQS